MTASDPLHAPSTHTKRALAAYDRTSAELERMREHTEGTRRRRIQASLVLIVISILAALAVTFSSGCAPSEPYRRADRLTFDAIAPEYSAYVAGDAGLSAKAKERRYRTLRTWDARSSTGEPETEPKFGEGD